MKRALLCVAATALLAGCSSPETQLRTALQDAGLSKPISSCMAERMVDRLSIWQLNKLRSLKKLKGKTAGEISFAEFLKRTKGLQDPEILGVVTSSGLICVVTG